MTDEYWIKGAEWKRNIPQGSAIQKRTPNSISPNKINIAKCFQASGERQKKSVLNYVGYMNKAAVADEQQVPNPTVGSMFVSTGATDTFKLGDITMTTKDEGGNRVDGGGYNAYCMLMVIDPATAEVTQAQQYRYWGYADGASESDRGWYSVLDEYTLVSSTEFPVGQAFLCVFDPSLEVQLTFAGQVITGDVTIDSVVDKVAYPNPFIVNPFAADITLGDIEMKTVDAGGNLQDGGGYNAYCMMMVLDPATAEVDVNKQYRFWGYADGASDSDRGWYSTLDEYTLINGTPVKAGDGFLCVFDTSLKTKLIFKNPIK